MIIVKIDGTDYQVCNEWKDITISRAAALHAIKMPGALRKCYEVALNTRGISEGDAEKKIADAENEITIDDQFKHFPRYFADVLVCLSDIPGEVIKKVDVISVKAMYHSYLKQFVEGVHFIPSTFQSTDIMSFDFDGETFYLPTDKKIFGQSVPMVDFTALEFCESGDLMVYLSKIQQDKDLSNIANLISILCRPKAEEYNESVCLARAERFKSLTMDVVWNVFFSLIAPLVILSQSVLISSLTQVIQKAKDQRI